MRAPSASVQVGSSDIVDAIHEVQRSRRRELARGLAEVALRSELVIAPLVVLSSFGLVAQESRSALTGAAIAAAIIGIVVAVARRLERETLHRPGVWPERSLWILAVQPAVACWLMVTFAMHVRLALGHWPQCGHCERPHLAFHDDVAIVSTFLIAPLSFLLWGLVAAFAFARGIAKETLAKTSVVLVSSSALLVIAFAMDPYGFFTWILD